MKQECLWEGTSPEAKPSLPTLQNIIETDVAIIGGGITGLSTALHLAEQNINVTLLEAGDIPSGGSGRNVGLVNAGAWIPPDDILKILGEENGERMTRILGEAPALVFSMIDRFNIDCQSTRNGTLHLAHNTKGVRELERRYQQLKSRGAPVELLDEARSCHLVGSLRVPAALLDRRAGTLNPTAYTRGLARAAVQAGADIYTQTPVEHLKRLGPGWLLTTPSGMVKSQRVVLATNAYTQNEWNIVRRHFFKGYYFQVASEPLHENKAGEILPDRQGAWDTKMVLSSIRRDAEGRLLLGTMGSGTGKPLSYMQAWANSVQRYHFPQLGKVNWECSWTGTIGFTPNHTLRIFEPAPGILAVSGYNGRGITTGTAVGKGFAHYIATGDPSLLPLPLMDYSPISGATIRTHAYDSAFTLYHCGQCLRVIT